MRKGIKKDFGYQALGGVFQVLIYLLSELRLISLMCLEKVVAAIFLGHSDFSQLLFPSPPREARS